MCLNTSRPDLLSPLTNTMSALAPEREPYSRTLAPVRNALSLMTFAIIPYILNPFKGKVANATKIPIKEEDDYVVSVRVHQQVVHGDESRFSDLCRSTEETPENHLAKGDYESA